MRTAKILNKNEISYAICEHLKTLNIYTTRFYVNDKLVDADDDLIIVVELK